MQLLIALCISRNPAASAMDAIGVHSQLVRIYGAAFTAANTCIHACISYQFECSYDEAIQHFAARKLIAGKTTLVSALLRLDSVEIFKLFDPNPLQDMNREEAAYPHLPDHETQRWAQDHGPDCECECTL